MGFIDRFRKKKKQAKTAADYRAEREGYAQPLVNGLDPASTALLYTTVASDHVDESDTPDLSDDTAKDDTMTQESYSYKAPEYDNPVDEVYQPSWSGSDYSYSDTSSYSDSSSSDSGSFSSSD